MVGGVGGGVGTGSGVGGGAYIRVDVTILRVGAKHPVDCRLLCAPSCHNNKP